MGIRLVSGLRQQPPAFWVNLGSEGHLDLPAGIRGLLRIAAIRRQSIPLAVATYPIAALVVPVIWATRARRIAEFNKLDVFDEVGLPFAADILLTLPFLIDTVGNAVDFYDSISWWDDVNHLVNWALLFGAVGALAWRSNVRPWQTLVYVVGFGAVTAILWELAEYIAFIRFSSELNTAYVDTLGDMALGLSGSVLAGLAAALTPHRQRT